MSTTGRAMIEFKNPHIRDWFASARIFTYGDVDSQSVVAHPWGEWEEADREDRPPPVVKPKGLPDDLSIMAISDIFRVVTEDPDPAGEARYCTPEESEGWVSARIPGYRLDPDEWCCTTWLTTEEMARVCDAYRARKKRERGCPELEGALAMMRAIEAHGPVSGVERTKARIVWWFTR